MFTRIALCIFATSALAIGCSAAPSSYDASSDESELQRKQTYCAIATTSGHSYYAHNFQTYAEAKTWLATLAAKEGRIETGACAKPIACPMVYIPLCASVSGSEAATFGNTCELLAATRMAAGAAPPGEAKGAFLHAGACVDPKDPPPVPPGITDPPEGGDPTDPPTPSTKPCSGLKCGASCPSMFGSPVATFCDAAGECKPSVPVCK
jgi:hypothetical protein